MVFTLLAILILPFTISATTINKPSLGLSYSWLWDYSNTYKYLDTHILSIYGGIPVIKNRVNIGLEAGIEIPFTNEYSINRSNEYLYIGSDTNIYLAEENKYYHCKSTNITVSIPVTLYIKSFFLETAIGVKMEIGKEILRDTIICSSRGPDGYTPFDKRTENFDGRFLSIYSNIIYSLGYQFNHFQFMLTGRDLFSVGFEIRYLYWKKLKKNYIDH